jgi:hypothetical protein
MQGDDSSLVPGGVKLLEALSGTVVRGCSVLLSCHELILSQCFRFAHSVSHNSVGLNLVGPNPVGLNPVGHKPVGHRPLDRKPIQ